MRLKGVGVILLLMAAYLAVQGFFLALPNDILRAGVYALVAILSLLTVRAVHYPNSESSAAPEPVRRLPRGR